jgi:DNA-binding XRE family transcriptional regulator
MRVMSNLASLLKQELTRVARRELRSETASLRKAVNLYRGEIAALKRRALALESELRRLRKLTNAEGVVPPTERDAPRLRFSPKGLAAQRRRLGLSAQDCGLLVGASGQSIYNWEEGKVRPRARHLQALAALRDMGKKDVAARLSELRAA